MAWFHGTIILVKERQQGHGLAEGAYDMATTGRKNYVVFIMDGRIAFAGTQKAYNEWSWDNVPGRVSWGVRLDVASAHRMAWEFFSRKRAMDEFVANFPDVEVSGEFASQLLPGTVDWIGSVATA